MSAISRENLVRVRYLRDVDQPDFLKAQAGDVVALPAHHAQRLIAEGYVEPFRELVDLLDEAAADAAIAPQAAPSPPENP